MYRNYSSNAFHFLSLLNEKTEDIPKFTSALQLLLIRFS